MAEYIERMSAIATACKGCNKEFSNEPCEPSECYIQQGLFTIPATDVVEVVRCRDCKAFVRNSRVDTDRGDCYRYGIGCVQIKKIDDFCSYGERKGDGNVE